MRELKVFTNLAMTRLLYRTVRLRPVSVHKVIGPAISLVSLFLFCVVCWWVFSLFFFLF